MVPSMGVTLTSWILGPEQATSITQFRALVAALTHGSVVKPGWILAHVEVDSSWRVETAFEPNTTREWTILQRGASFAELERALATVDLPEPPEALVCVFAGIEATHPSYAFHYDAPEHCVVAAVALREPVAISASRMQTEEEADGEFPEEEECTVRSAAWLMFDGFHAPYQGELVDSYLAELTATALGAVREVLTLAHD